MQIRNSILERLVSVDSSNAAGVKNCVRIVAEIAAQHNIKSIGIGNGIILSNGKTGARGIVLSGHLDVVPVADQEWKFPPFELTQDGDKLYGRGTSDMKGGVSCMLNAMISENCDFPLYLALSADEETGGKNVYEILDYLKSQNQELSCIVGEPTELDICDRHKGSQCFAITFSGIPCHAAKPQNGVSSIFMFSDFVREYREMTAKIPDATINVGIVNGGTASNIVPEKCVAVIGHRAFADNDFDFINNGVIDIFAGLESKYVGGRIESKQTCEYMPLKRRETSPIRDLCGRSGGGEIKDFGAVSEASAFQSAGLDTILCGPGFLGMAHRPDEYTSSKMLDDYDALLAGLIKNF
jgi:acetylornithine deacetylase